jgi:hypothetical protein
MRLGVGSILAAMVMTAAARGQTTTTEKTEPSPIKFEAVAASGVEFRFDAGSRGRHDLPEIMGGGVAVFDVDGDGRNDIFLCEGGPIVPAPGVVDPPCRLYRNRGNWRFEDVTSRAAAPGPSYAMGAAVGDYDNDGRADLFVSGWRDQRLYRNLGDCRFADVTRQAGLASSLWSTSAAWGDLDGDGDLDLYVANYLEYEPDSAPYCAAPDGRRDYCGPEDFVAQRDKLYRNNGNGTFTDVAAAAAIDEPAGRGLGVLIAELTGDNRPDIFVANDGTACWLFANQGGLKFQDVAPLAGVAFDGQGRALAGMGVALADLDGDLRSDLVVTNFLDRSTVAFRAQAGFPGQYRDESESLGIAAATRSVLGFGIALHDFDGDGAVDLLQANGHVLDRARLGTPFAMRTRVLRNIGGRLVDISDQAGPAFGRPIIGRGLAVGDLDGDGRPDVLINALDSPAALLRNASTDGFRVSLDVVDQLGRPAVGAKVRLTAGGRIRAADLTGGGSYLSASPNRLEFCLGGDRTVERITVLWPFGRLETWDRPNVGDGLIRVRQGTGRTAP